MQSIGISQIITQLILMVTGKWQPSSSSAAIFLPAIHKFSPFATRASKKTMEKEKEVEVETQGGENNGKHLASVGRQTGISLGWL